MTEVAALPRTCRRCRCQVGPGDGDRVPPAWEPLSGDNRGDGGLCDEGEATCLGSRATERCDLHGDRTGYVGRGLAGDRGRRDDRRTMSCTRLCRFLTDVTVVKLVPVMVTAVPPDGLPFDGVTAVTVGLPTNV